MLKKLWEKVKGFKTGGLLYEFKLPELPPFTPYAYVDREPILSGGKQFWVVKEVMDRGMCDPDVLILPNIYVVGYYEDKEAAQAAAEKRTIYLDEKFNS